MGKELASIKFDYGKLEKIVVNQSEQVAVLINKQRVVQSNSAVETGKLLVTERELLANSEHGKKLSFGLWVETKCRFSRKTAYQYIDAYEFSKGNEKAIPFLETTALLQLPKLKEKHPEVVAAAIKLANSDQVVTGKVLNELKKKFEQPEEEYEVDEPEEEEEEEIEVVEVKDGLKNVVKGEHLQEIFIEGKEFDEHIRNLNALIKWAGNVKQTGIGRHLDMNLMKVDIRNLKGYLVCSRPHVVCPKCKGKQSKCAACKGYGWINRTQYLNAKKGGVA